MRALRAKAARIAPRGSLASSSRGADGGPKLSAIATSVPMPAAPGPSPPVARLTIERICVRLT
jgi:hypothetical protein